MNNPFLIRRAGAIILCFMLLFSALAVAVPKAVLSGPSQAVAGDMVTLSGKHFTAGATFTVKTLVGKRSSQEVVTAGSDGSLSYQLVTGNAGTYQLQVRDSRNRLVATSVVMVHPAGG